MEDKYIKAIEKLAFGYEYEEMQTQVEETPAGTKKKIIKTKKHVAPNFQAIKYLIDRENPKIKQDDLLEEFPNENTEKFNIEVF